MWGRDAEFTEPSRGGSQRSGAVQRVNPTESRGEKAGDSSGWSFRSRFWLNHVQMSHTLGTREMGQGFGAGRRE